MPDDNQKDWLPPRPVNLSSGPANRPVPPSPPPPEITIRTLQSDSESLKQSGGAGPIPKTFAPPAPLSPIQPPPPPPLPSSPPRIAPSDFSAPKSAEKPTVSVIEEEAGKTGSTKKILSWSGGLLAAILIGLGGYFYLFPLLFPKQAPPPPPPAFNAQAPVVPIPEPEIVSDLRPHQSFFRSSDQTAAAKLLELNLDSLNSALKEAAAQSLNADTLTEVVFSDDGGQFPSSAVLTALLPEISAEAMKNLFEDDFTAAVYRDADGIWPAYIVKLKAEASQVEAQTEINKLESSLNLSNLFLSNPGSPSSAGFKTGQANGAVTRYLTYSQKGASLNIAWSGDKLVVSASYNGLKKVLGNL